MKPLLHDDSLTDDERALLRSARGDAPSPALRLQTLAALGIGAAAVGSSVTAHAIGKVATTASIGGGTAASVSAASTITAMVVAKWLAAGALVGTLASSSVVVVMEATGGPSVVTHTTSSGAAPTAAPTPRATGTFPLAGSAPDGTEAPLRPIDDLPSAASPDSDAERGGALPGTRPPAGEGAAAALRAGGDVLPSEAAMPPATRESRIAAEVASLDEARRALGSSDPAGALARLDTHARRFRSGTLEPEAVLLRVRALVALDRRAEARAAAARFLAANPASPQAARLQALVGR